MTPELVRAFAQISAYNAQIAGMVAANVARSAEGKALAYDENAFETVAEYLRNIAAYL